MKALRHLFVALIACAFMGSFAAPAQAQSLIEVLDFVTDSATNVENATNGSSCSYAQGVSNVACQIRRARYRADQLQQINNRVERQREAARRREAAARGEIHNASFSQVQLCSWNQMEYCRELGISPQQAVAAMNNRQLNFNGQQAAASPAKTAASNQPQAAPDLSRASESQIQLCSWGVEEYCRTIGATTQQALAAMAARSRGTSRTR